MEKLFDIVLWGATGYTGQLVAEYLARNVDSSVRWAIAGRNREKLEKLRVELTAVSPTATTLPILLGDSLDRGSLDAIVSQTKVVCSTVGPYSKFGTPLVASCVAHGVDYCDLTAETLWMRQNIDAFHALAEQTGARIVHCCGYDAIPSDLGTLLLQEKAYEENGRYCTEVQTISWSSRGGFSGGTIASLLTMLDQARDDEEKAILLANPFNLVPEKTPDWTQVDQAGARFDETTQVWTGPFMMASINSRVVHRSHALQGWPYGQDFRYNESMRLPNRLAAASFGAVFRWGKKALAVPALRKWLEGNVLPNSGEGPSAELRARGYFETRVVGDGARTAVSPIVIIKDSLDPGYGATAKMLAESALCLAFDDLPARGGILTRPPCWEKYSSLACIKLACLSF